MRTVTQKIKGGTETTRRALSLVLSLLMIMLSLPNSVLATTTDIVESEFTVPADVVGNSTVSKALGIDPEKYLSWLESHERDNYYLGTQF